MKKISFPADLPFHPTAGKSPPPPPPPHNHHLPAPSAAGTCWFDDACILDMDYFVKTITGVKAKGVRPDLIGSIIAHYASKWLPELISSTDATTPALPASAPSEESMTAQWMKKRFFVETLVGILPPERDSVPCNFLLRLLRTANMVGAEPGYRAELEARAAWQLETASLKELMIPSFSHTCGTVLDVELVTRLVRMFVGMEEVSSTASSRSVAAAGKVARLVDAYLAEVAMDSNLSLLEFVSLAGSMPDHARSSDDGLYRAIDTYLKAHPGVSKQERKSLCRLIDSRKLSPQASVHAAQNERLPVRVVIQVLFAEQNKINNNNNKNRQIEWSGSFNTTTNNNDLNSVMNMTRSSPKPDHQSYNIADHVSSSTRCHSKREVNAQQSEIRKLKEDVLRLQSQCLTMETQMERMAEKRRGMMSSFKWKKLGFLTSFRSGEKMMMMNGDEGDVVVSGSLGRQTPMDMKAKLVKRTTPPRWRKSMS